MSSRDKSFFSCCLDLDNTPMRTAFVLHENENAK